MKKRKSLTMTEKALQALRDAVAKVVEDHRRSGRPLAVWRDGKAVSVAAAKLKAPRKTPMRNRGKAKI